jgi:hypothetical protein
LAPLVIAPIVLVFPTLFVIVVEAPQATHPIVCSASPTPFASTFSPTGIPWELHLDTSILLGLTRSLSPTPLDLYCTTNPTTNIDLTFCTTIIPVPHSMEFFLSPSFGLSARGGGALFVANAGDHYLHLHGWLIHHTCSCQYRNLGLCRSH